jgi:hypothetical protein
MSISWEIPRLRFFYTPCICARVESLFFVRRRFDQGSVTCASGCTNPVLNIFTVSAQSNSRYYMAEIQTEMVENVVVYITK